jgi:hypothetical protein
MLMPFFAFAHGIREADKQRMLDWGLFSIFWTGGQSHADGLRPLAVSAWRGVFLTTFKDIVKFVTVFTVGHCITLVFATFFQNTWQVTNER